MYSIVDYTATEDQDTFNVTMPYLDQSHIYVYLNGTDITQYVEFNNPTEITLVADGELPAPDVDAGDIVRIRRITPIDEPLVDYANGSNLGESDLDTQGLQNLYLLQETRDQLDLEGLEDVLTAMNAALAAQAAAELAETNAETAETNAETAETNAELAETNAELAETNAETAETNAETAASNAATSASNAATSASNAATSASNAATSASNAQTAETNAETAEANAETAEANAEIAQAAAEAAQAAAEAAAEALDVITTEGDLIYGNVTPVPARLPIGSEGDVLTVTSGIPSWEAPSSGSGSGIYQAYSTTDTLDDGVEFADLSGASFTFTLPAAGSHTDRRVVIRHSGTSLTQEYTITAQGGETIIAADQSIQTYKLFTNGETLTIVSDGSNWRVLHHEAQTPWTTVSGITVTAVTSNPTKATTRENDEVLWKRSGDMVDVIFRYAAASATGGAAGSGAYIWNFPTGITAHSSHLTEGAADLTDAVLAMIGYGGATIEGSSVHHGAVYLASNSGARMSYWAASNTDFGSGFYPFTTANLAWTLRVRFQHANWRP